MTQREIVHLNRDDPRQRAMLGVLTDTVFGFTFDAWHAAGGWDDRYRVYSVIDGDRIIASAAVAMVDLLIWERPVPAIQIGAVATLPDCRGQGLARQLMDHALAQYPGMPAFLFAHQGVVDFYPRFGFLRVSEAQPYLALGRSVDGTGHCRRLSPDDPDVARFLAGRQRFSGILDARNAVSINRFHLIMGFADDSYHVPEGDALVVARQQGGRLTLYDVICDTKLRPEAIVAQLPFTGVDTVEFAFTPDWLCRDYSLRPYDSVAADSYLFVRGLDWPRDAKFPHLAMT